MRAVKYGRCGDSRGKQNSCGGFTGGQRRTAGQDSQGGTSAPEAVTGWLTKVWQGKGKTNNGW